MLKNMKIRMKFTLLTVFLFVAMLALFAISRQTMTRTAIGGEAYVNIVMAKDLTADILPPPLYIVESYMEMLELIRVGEAGALDRTAQTIQGKKAEYETRRELWRKDFPEGEIKRLLLGEVCTTAASIYQAFEGGIATAVRAGDMAGARRVLDETVSPLFARHRTAVERLAGLLDAFSKEAEAGGVKAVEAGSLLLSAGFAGTALAVLALFMLLSRDFTRSFAQCLGFARDAAAGRLDCTIECTRRDDFGELSSALAAMLGELNKTIRLAESKTELANGEVEKSRLAIAEAEAASARAELARAGGLLQAAGTLEDVVVIVTSSSRELSEELGQSSQGAERQAQRAGETATAMEEMNASVLEVARSASQAAGMADRARHKAQDGARVVAQVVEGIGKVQAQALGMKADMATLGQQAESIGAIMQIIEDIADQTNLLALNAAIEAARAGEAGRGFAVVADEVRKLAEKTMTATKQVGDAIRSIQKGTRTNLHNVEAAVGRIGEATDLATNSGAALAEIVSLVDNTTDQVRSIATAAEQQSAVSDEITRSIEDVNRISTETSDTMRHAAKVVTELARQAQVLTRLVDELKQEGDGAQELRVAA